MNNISYKPIKTEFVWTGDGLGNSQSVTLRQLKREGDIAIYSRTTKAGRISYEIIKIHRHNGYTLGGQYVEPSETYPGSSQWGKVGFDAMTLERAEEKFNQLIAAETNRVNLESEAAAQGIVLKRRGRPRKIVGPAA